ncbi:MAG: putative DNA repair protein MutK [Marinomonas primoryensis]|jgi:predicted DNA repair protein MutK
MTMAMTGLLALLDDITTLLDDVAIFSKVAVKKTAGVLGDDLALNAEQVSGVKADRELPVVWAVAKGSFLNKLILVPLALAISAFVPWLIQPLLMAGGLYLCFEGAEKILHSFKNNKDEKDTLRKNVQQAKSDAELLTLEKDKVRGAIRTDFVLSAEIIVIALGTVADQDLITQALVVSLIAFVVTVGVYLLVGLIVRLDDIGLHLHQSSKKIIQQLGFVILKGAPMLIRLLTIVGTIAMFLVGGGIFVHGLPVLHHVAELAVSGDIAQLRVMTSIISTGVSLLVGLIIGSVAVLIASFLPKKPQSKESEH